MKALKEIFIKTSEIDISKMSETETLNLLISISSLAIAALSLVIALIVLFYAAYQFILKRGSRFCGAFSISSSIWSNQRYVGEIIIENTKDRAAAISTIYLRLGRNIYLELVDYSHSPRIVAPFETIKIGFQEGVSGYISSTFKVNLDSLLANKKVSKNLVIATPQGLSKVKNYKTLWNVYIESLKNFFIVPVHPVKKYHNGEYYSDALQFIVTNTNNRGQHEEHRLYRGATYKINGISVSTDDFSSADDLECFLAKSKTPPDTLTVECADYSYNDYDAYQEVEINHHGFFGTYITGAAYTKLHRLILFFKNKLNR